MQLRDIMSTRVATVEPAEPASAAWSRMQGRGIRYLVVTKNSQLHGVLSERDLGGRSGSSVRKGRRVQDLMIPRVVTAEPETSLRQAADLMRKLLIGCLPVLENDQLVGIVTATDVLDELGRGSIRRAKRQTLRSPARSKQRSSRRAVGPPARTESGHERAVFPGWLPRALKRESGRSDAPLVPAHIRGLGVDLDQDSRRNIRRKLTTKLGKFAASIERVSVRVKDVNGPRGGVDQVCRIKVVLSNLPSVLFERQDVSLNAAIDGALVGVVRAVRRVLQHRRMKPLKQGARVREAVPAG